MSDVRASLEADIARRLAARDLDGATTRAIEGYGPELFGFVQAIVRSRELATEAFAELCEDLWRGLPRFEQRASFRTWLYTLARHAAFRRLRKEKRARAELPLDDDAPAISRLQQRARTLTVEYLRTATRSRLTEMRESLPPEDQALLILRIDKQLDWNELVRVLSDGELDEAALKRESARLRKRFQLLKERLREQARKEGLLGGD